MSQELLYQVDDDIATITFNRPERMNALLGRKPSCGWCLSLLLFVSIAFGLIAVGRAWYDFRPRTDEERSRLRQEGN